ncbi:MAG TPA: hypothetical protein ENN75_02610 [candidate division Zixibacteria bacterium]|nr:hypothetical protein [candidate division Zixibacteria bacterium]
MKLFALIFLICLISIPLFSQSKTPQLGRENTGEELTKPSEQKDLSSSTPDPAEPQKSKQPAGSEAVKPYEGNVLPSSLSDSEAQAWDMIFRPLEKDPYSRRLQTKQPPTRIDNQSATGSREPKAGKHSSGGEKALSSSRGHGRRPDVAIPVDISGVARRGSAGKGNSSRGNVEGKREEVEVENENDGNREGLPSNRPPGWDVGKKEGWKGGNVPPGLDTPPGLRKQNQNRQRKGN